MLGFFRSILRFIGGLIRLIFALSVIISFGIFALIVVAIVSSDGPSDLSSPLSIDEDSLLVINPSGFIQESSPHDQIPSFLNFDLDDGDGVSVHAITRALQKAKTDPRITEAMFDMSNIASLSPSIANELVTAIEDFKTSGKKIVSVSTVYDQTLYLVASATDAIFLDEEGILFFEGFNRFRLYYADAMERFNIVPHVYAVGDFKSAPEPFTRNSMSEADQTQSRVWLDDLWTRVKQNIAARRGLEEDAIQTYADRFHDYITASKGDFADSAMRTGFIDGLLWVEPEGFHAVTQVASSSPISLEDAKALIGNENKIDFGDYFHSEYVPPEEDQQGIGVLYTEGVITPGRSSIGSGEYVLHDEVFIEQLWDMADLDNVSGILIRMDSPGGSVFASERIRRAIATVRDKTDKPIVVSFSSYGASGAYYLATAADLILSDPWALTGSIGVFGLTLEFTDAAAWLGAYEDGVGTTAFAGALSPLRPPSVGVQEILRQSTQRTYREFIRLVSTARNIPEEDLEPLASGRVWTGGQAQALGLVDKTANFQEALRMTAKLAGLDSDSVQIIELPPPSFVEELVMKLGNAVQATQPEAFADQVIRHTLLRGIPQG